MGFKKGIEVLLLSMGKCKKNKVLSSFHSGLSTNTHVTKPDGGVVVVKLRPSLICSSLLQIPSYGWFHMKVIIHFIFFNPSSKFAAWHLLTIAHNPGIVRVKCTFNSSFLGAAVRCWYRTPPLPFLSSYFMLHTFLSPTSSWNAAFKSSTKNLVIVVASSFTHWKHWSSDGVKTSYLKSSHAKLFSTEK